MKILAIDDELLALESLMASIQKAVPEAELYGFRYPDEALKFAGEQVCDVAFCDIRMVEMSGIVLAE